MKKNLITIVLIGMLALALYGCQPVTNTGTGVGGATLMAMPELLIHAHEYTYELPQQIAAGLVRITLMNDGKEPHHAQLFRLNDDATLDQFTAALAGEDVGKALQMVTLPGGAAPIDPNGSTSIIVNLPSGNYVVVCLVPSPDGVPHLAKGMMVPFTVVASDETALANQTKLTAQATVKLVNFSFVLPENIQAGKQIWEVVNEGDQPHEMNLMKLAAGKTLDDLRAWMQAPAGPPPFANVGGFNGIDPQGNGWMELDLTPGDYIAICHIPDSATGKPHEELGMMLPFTVK